MFQIGSWGFRGVPLGFRGLLRFSRSVPGGLVVFHGVSGTFQGVQIGFREVQERPRVFQSVLGSLSEFQGVIVVFHDVSGTL